VLDHVAVYKGGSPFATTTTTTTTKKNKIKKKKKMVVLFAEEIHSMWGRYNSLTSFTCGSLQ
jgi:hypothetical protein